MRRGESLFSFKHGDHTCVFYSDLNSLLEVLTPFIAEGLRNGERCFCAQTQETLRALSNELRFLGVDVEREAKRGALELHTVHDVYFARESFDPAGMMDMLERSIDDAVREGFTAFRTAGELCWASEGNSDCDRLIDYEKMVQASYPNKPALGICQYPIQKFRPEILERVVGAHGKVLHNAVPGGIHSSLSIRHTKCEAEIVTNKFTLYPSYQYVVQHQNGEILHWGQSSDFDGALKSVEKFIAVT